MFEIQAPPRLFSRFITNTIRTLVTFIFLFLCFSPRLSKATALLTQPGDVIQWQIPSEAARESTINLDGELDLDIYGKIQVSGFSAGEVEEKVRQALSAYVLEPNNIVVRVVAREGLVSVSGMVASPGLVRIGQEADLWRAIQLAGKPLPDADLTRVSVQTGSTTTVVDVRAALTRSTNTLPIVPAGSSIFVPAVQGYSPTGISSTVFLSNPDLHNKVIVLGGVRSPGIYDRSPTATIPIALAAAGGCTNQSDTYNIRIITSETSITVDFIREPNITLPTAMGATIIYVPFIGQERLGDIAPFINIIGDVHTPGRHPIVGAARLLDAIAAAGGPKNNSSLRSVTLIRFSETTTRTVTYNLRRAIRHGLGPLSMQVQPSDTIIVGSGIELSARHGLQLLSDVSIIAAAIAVLAGLQ